MNKTENVSVKESALKRFLEVALGLGAPVDFCHQTLTFKQEKASITEVKVPLYRLLDSVHKRFEMVSLYAIEWGKQKRLHAHVLFLFYETLPYNSKHWQKKFGSVVFKKWNQINGGALNRQANQMTRPKALDPTYFIKHIQTLPRSGRKNRAPANWWGVRNKKMLNQHRVPVDQGRLKTIMLDHKGPRNSAVEPGRRENKLSRKSAPLIVNEQFREVPTNSESSNNQLIENQQNWILTDTAWPPSLLVLCGRVY